MYFIEIPFQGWGKSVHESPASLYNPSCAPSKSRGWQIIHGQGRDDIVYFYLVKYIWTFEHPPAILQSSSDLHLLPMIYDCSPRGIHSATTDSEEWKISHFRKIFSRRRPTENILNFGSLPCKFDLISCKATVLFDVWWCLVSDLLCHSNTQFCHHKSFSMFFLW